MRVKPDKGFLISVTRDFSELDIANNEFRKMESNSADGNKYDIFFCEILIFRDKLFYASL